ncbi:MAG: hypothetical protein KBH86_13065 [Syntrophorhabdus sp.]|nr:hypothetical protein [Syntrophorhabdus sp.]
MSDIKLPAVIDSTLPALVALTDALGVPREILASDEEIEAAWLGLPRVLRKIPPQRRTEELGRMCVAVAVGLFDGAINYVWNATVLELREKVRAFGLMVVRQVTGNTGFDEDALQDLKDADLLSLCLKLNLITEDGFFFLDQCRDIRNNFSAAHPAMGKIDDSEFIAFVNRCAKYGLGDEKNPVGVDIQAFVTALKAGKFSQEQEGQWVQRLKDTHEAQRELLFGTLHGMYCDPVLSEETRLNALSISKAFVDSFTPKIQSDLINRHQDYVAKGETKRHGASQQYFEKLGLLAILGDAERHGIISNACKRLFSVHQAFDNFYNEPPFAERLYQIIGQVPVPDTVKQELVETVVTCAVGNAYGVSRAAYPYYARMIKGFMPSEIVIMLQLPETRTVVGTRIGAYPRCKTSFSQLVSLIDPESVPVKYKRAYVQWRK